MGKMRFLILVPVLCFLLCACTHGILPSPTPGYRPPESPYTPEDFRFSGDYLACTAGATVMGIDVSSHQGSIDWQAVGQSGIRFVFVRLGYRGYSDGSLHADPQAAENLAGARAAGLQVGAYFFSQALTPEEAREEAAFALEILDGFVPDLPVVYDWEYVSADARTGNMDRRTLTDCTLTFCQEIAKGGRDPMIYFNSSQSRDLLYLEELEQYPWWLAKYDLAMDFPCKVDLWQYTNQGQLPGITGNVDIDLMFTEYGLGQQVFGTSEG